MKAESCDINWFSILFNRLACMPAFNYLILHLGLNWQVKLPMRKLFRLTTIAVALWLTNDTKAQTNYYWTNSLSAATTPWSVFSNWTNGAPTQNGGSNYLLNFAAGIGVYSASNNFAGNFMLNGLNFGAGTVSLYGNLLVFTNNGIGTPLVTNYSGNVANINNSIVLGSDTTLGSVNDMTVNGIISGNGSLKKSGIGILILTNSNSYTGTTTVSGGTLQLSPPIIFNNVLNSTTNIIVQSSGTLSVTNRTGSWIFAV